MSSEMACRAASLISAGAAKSGKPCERFTALCFSASRVISRITDSVNCSAFAESMRRASCVIVDSFMVETKSLGSGGKKARLMVMAGSGGRYRDGGRNAGAVNHAVDFGVAQNDLHVVARFRERDRFHEFRNFVVIAFGAPKRDAIFAGVKRGQRIFRCAKIAQQSGDVHHADLQVKIGLEQ